jgi:hypothetical protein
MPNKYTVIPQGLNGSHMVAAETISRGTLIIAEKPLLEIDVGRKDRFDEDAFWSAGACSGAQEVLEIFKDVRTSSVTRKKFEELTFCWPKDAVQLTRDKDYKKDALTVEMWELLNRFQTNCFEREHPDERNVTRIRFTVFYNISRINHSCDPNAAYHWDPDANKGRGQGKIHALTRIPANQEITVCYLKELDFLLGSRRDRLHQLRTTWKFTCSCGVCNQPADQDAPGADDPQRAMLEALHDSLKLVEPPTPRASPTIAGDTHTNGDEEREHTQYLTDISELTQFAEGLAGIGVKDERLGDA